MLLDLFQGPQNPALDHPLYGAAALRRFREALAPDGILGVWAEHADRRFERTLETAGFRVRRHRPGRGGLRHAVYLAVRADGTRGGPPRAPVRRRRSSAP